jgi:conjugal transfer pilus assembly protein TraW
MDAAQIPQPPAVYAPAAPAAWDAGAALGAALDRANKAALAASASSSPISPIPQAATAQQANPAAAANTDVIRRAKDLASGAMKGAATPALPGSVQARGRSSALEQMERYARFARLPDGRMAFLDTINGQPVLPPGMSAEQISQYLSHDWPAMRRKTAKTFIFISLGMPEERLRNLFAQVAADQKVREDVVFVVRGWPDEPEGLPKMVGKLYALQPKGSDPLPVFVDPTLFEANRIERVPVILRRLPQGSRYEWGAIAGDGLAVADAVSRLDAQRDLSGEFGQTWAVSEPDELALIKERVAKYDFAAEKARVLASGWKDAAAKAAKLPQSERGIDTLHDPSVVAIEDIRLPDGRLVAQKGQRINPLAQAMPWQSLRYIAFNASSEWEIEQAKAWLAKYPSAKVLVTSPPDTADGFMALQQRIGARAFILQPLVAERLGIVATPALVWPQGLSLAVHVEPIPRGTQQ